MTSTNFTVKFYSDPGHGWGAVKRKVLDDLGISEKISLFSYQKGQTVYLEEDCDLPHLVTKLATKGVVVQYTTKHTDRTHPIRSYNRFKV